MAAQTVGKNKPYFFPLCALVPSTTEEDSESVSTKSRQTELSKRAGCVLVSFLAFLFFFSILFIFSSFLFGHAVDLRFETKLRNDIQRKSLIHIKIRCNREPSVG